jgi:hypothetical protein
MKIKNIIFAVIIISLLSGCNMELAKDCEKWLDFDDSIIPANIDSFDKISNWVWDNFKYKKIGNDFSLPEKTLHRGYGDCTDFAILIIALVWKRCHIKCRLAHGLVDGNGHVEAIYNNRRAKDFEGKFDIYNYIEFDDIKYELYNYTIIK